MRSIVTYVHVIEKKEKLIKRNEKKTGASLLLVAEPFLIAIELQEKHERRKKKEKMMKGIFV